MNKLQLVLGLWSFVNAYCEFHQIQSLFGDSEVVKGNLRNERVILVV
jgi:hypothetical protein